MRGAIATSTSRACGHANSATKVTVSVATKQSLLDNLTRYKVGSFGRARDAGFSSVALATALKEVNKHLVVPAIKQHQKARWIYCCNAEQLVMLSTLVPQIGEELEYFYLGGTVAGVVDVLKPCKGHLHRPKSVSSELVPTSDH